LLNSGSSQPETETTISQLKQMIEGRELRRVSGDRAHRNFALLQFDTIPRQMPSAVRRISTPLHPGRSRNEATLNPHRLARKVTVPQHSSPEEAYQDVIGCSTSEQNILGAVSDAFPRHCPEFAIEAELVVMLWMFILTRCIKRVG
jgi:hypothetical protein